jgi:hypothetical protein
MDGVGVGATRSAPARAPSRQAWHRERSTVTRAPDLRKPVQLLIVSVLLMAGDYAYAVVTGEVLRFGPARMFWLAGPLALIGAALLVTRLLNHDE